MKIAPYIQTSIADFRTCSRTYDEYIKKVIEIESPVHIEEALLRIREAAGFGRTGSKIRSTFFITVNRLERLGLVTLRGDFLWKSGDIEVYPRNRSEFTSQRKKHLYICDEELAVAVILLCGHCMGIKINELKDGVYKLFGFARVTADMNDRISQVINRLHKNSDILLSGDIVRLKTENK